MAVCCFFAVKNLPIMDITAEADMLRYIIPVIKSKFNFKEELQCVTFIFVLF